MIFINILVRIHLEIPEQVSSVYINLITVWSYFNQIGCSCLAFENEPGLMSGIFRVPFQPLSFILETLKRNNHFSRLQSWTRNNSDSCQTTVNCRILYSIYVYAKDVICSLHHDMLG